MSPIARVTLIACLAFAGPLSAGEPGDPGEQVETEVEAALILLAERGALGSADKPITISRPAQVRYELGAVVDVRAPDPKGLEVLAITPGGAAARMGLKAGDRLLAINGRRLDGDSPPADALKTAMRNSDGKLALLAARGRSRVELEGRAAPAAIPAYQLTIGETRQESRAGCGYVSYSALPPRSQDLFPVFITQIDGRSTPGLHVNRLRVPAGRHVLTVAERIPEYRLNGWQNQQRMRLMRHPASLPFKAFVIDVQPDTEHRIGTRLFKDQLDYEGIHANAYWEPVVWDQRAATCD